jgi:predicted permease
VGISEISGDYFDVLGVRPALGRLFNTADNEREGAHPYVVLSHSFWKRALAEDTGIVGRDVLLNGIRFQVIGVSREGFTGPNVGASPDIFVPIIMHRTLNPTELWWNTRHMWWLTVIGRLKPGIMHGRAEAELNALWKQILDADPEKHPAAAWDTGYKTDNTLVILPGSQGYSLLRSQTSKPLTILMITTGLVLLIACANVANLLLARAAGRGKEVAVRLAVGAGRGRLVTQMLTESITLGILGGLAGLAVAWFGVKVLLTFLPGTSFPVALNVSPDVRLLGFAFALSTLTGLIFGLAPALRASRPDLVSALKAGAGAGQGGRSAVWDLRRTLVSLQVALSLLLLSGAGLFVRTLANLRGLDPGLKIENLLFVDTNLREMGYQPQRERTFVERLCDETQRLPGVRAASLADIAPLGGSRWNGDVQIEGYHFRPDERPYVDMNAVAPRFFEVAGIPILLGRDFRDSDNLAVLPNRPDKRPEPGADLPDPPGPPRVAIVNEAFVRHFFRGQSALGRRLCLGEKWDPAKLSEIVGVVRDVLYFDPRRSAEPMIYQPLHGKPGMAGNGILCVRTTADPNRLVDAVRRRAQAIDGAVSITQTRTMEDNVNRNLVQERFVATLGGFFGVVALLLAAIGLYGVIAQAVARRTREIGIRMALGAEGRGVLWMVLREAVLMIAVGALAGLPVILAVTRYIESLLFGVKPHDPVTLAAAATVLLAVTIFAGFFPARRATQVDPMVALRDE